MYFTSIGIYFLWLFQLYIGGVPNQQVGMKARVNFTGCMENLFINGTSIIPEMQAGNEDYMYYYGIPKFVTVNTEPTCPVSCFLW